MQFSEGIIVQKNHWKKSENFVKICEIGDFKRTRREGMFLK